MVHAIAGDTGDVVPACVWAGGQYGISDVFVGLPARLGHEGVREVVELELDDPEARALREAAEGIRERCSDLGKL
jgi:malate dehydrogenase